MLLPDMFLQQKDGCRVERAAPALQPRVMFFAHVTAHGTRIVCLEVVAELALELNPRLLAAKVKSSL